MIVAFVEVDTQVEKVVLAWAGMQFGEIVFVEVDTWFLKVVDVEVGI